MNPHISSKNVRALGLDFGTTNTVVALGQDGASAMVDFVGPDGASEVFRSALCFWHDESVKSGLAREAGPWAIAEYLEYPEDSRFLQSFKTVAASASFETASVFGKRFRFEELGRIFLERLVAQGVSEISCVGGHNGQKESHYVSTQRAFDTKRAS